MVGRTRMREKLFRFLQGVLRQQRLGESYLIPYSDPSLMSFYYLLLVSPQPSQPPVCCLYSIVQPRTNSYEKNLGVYVKMIRNLSEVNQMSEQTVESQETHAQLRMFYLVLPPSLSVFSLIHYQHVNRLSLLFTVPCFNEWLLASIILLSWSQSSGRTR